MRNVRSSESHTARRRTPTPKNQDANLRALVRKLGKAVSDLEAAVAESDQPGKSRVHKKKVERKLPKKNRPFDKNAKPIWEKLEEIAKEVPQEEWDSLPSDLSDQLDHYIYGVPKR